MISWATIFSGAALSAVLSGALVASWQDTGSGVFTFAVSTLALGLGPLAADTGRRTVTVASLPALIAFVVDVYLY